MKKKANRDDAGLRRRATEALAAMAATRVPAPRDLARAAGRVHELEVQQIELEMQAEELRRSRAELEAARDRYADLYDFAPIGYFTVNAEGAIEEVNLTGAKLLGVERARLVGRRLSSFIAAADHPLLEGAIAQALSNGEVSCEVTLAGAASPGAPARYLELTVLARGEASFRVAAVDATDRRRSEDLLRTSQKVEAIGQLAGGIAHDFNNLLTVILTNAGSALDAMGTESPGHEEVEEIRDAAEHAAALTRQLLAFSRNQIVRPETVDPNALLRNVTRMLQRLLGEDIQLVLNLAPDVGMIDIDPTQFDQIVLNLAVNARDAMPTGGALTLTTDNGEASRGAEPAPAGAPEAAAAGRVRLSVTDTGTGIDAAVLPHIFEPFFTTKAANRGTGLGLSTVLAITNGCGGKISVQSAPGKGTTFLIDWPRSVRPRLDEAPDDAPALRGAETVLVVEDEPALLRIVERALTRAGYTVLLAANGAEGLRRCEAHKAPLHLILSDVVMPGMSGVALVQRALPLHPEAKVLLMSGYTGDLLADRGLRSRAYPLLSKPFSERELRRKVRETLDESAGERASAVRPCGGT